MTNKELIEKVARSIMHDENTYRVGGEEYCETVARIAIATIRAALQEPNEAMIAAWDDGCHPETADGDWKVMLAASALAEQSG